MWVFGREIGLLTLGCVMRNICYVGCVWNVMAHAQKPDFVFRRNGRVSLNRRGRQFSRLLVAEVWASAAVMLDTPCSEVVWRVLVIHSIRHFPLHFPSRESPCAITFQLDSTWGRQVSQVISVFEDVIWVKATVFGETIKGTFCILALLVLTLYA